MQVYIKGLSENSPFTQLPPVMPVAPAGLYEVSSEFSLPSISFGGYQQALAIYDFVEIPPLDVSEVATLHFYLAQAAIKYLENKFYGVGDAIGIGECDLVHELYPVSCKLQKEVDIAFALYGEPTHLVYYTFIEDMAAQALFGYIDGMMVRGEDYSVTKHIKEIGLPALIQAFRDWIKAQQQEEQPEEKSPVDVVYITGAIKIYTDTNPASGWQIGLNEWGIEMPSSCETDDVAHVVKCLSEMRKSLDVGGSLAVNRELTISFSDETNSGELKLTKPGHDAVLCSIINSIGGHAFGDGLIQDNAFLVDIKDVKFATE